MTDQNEIRTPEEIEALKKNWLQDPCWDIEDTEGFEAHRDELLAWSIQYKSEIEEKAREALNKRIESIMISTGVGRKDANILMSIHDWGEIEKSVDIDHYVGDCGSAEAFAAYRMAQAQVRATLLQAAQLKRIADALETLADQDDNSFLSAYKIWGMK